MHLNAQSASKRIDKHWKIEMKTLPGRHAYSLIDLLAVIFVVAVTSVVLTVVRAAYGTWAGIGLGVCWSRKFRPESVG